MMYLSQILNKSVIFHNAKYGKILDLVTTSDASLPISHALISTKKKKYVVPIDDLEISAKSIILKRDTHFQPPNESSMLSLADDILDKQVIDITGKKLVRVNDVILYQNGELKIHAIDISWAGIMRRLGVTFNVGKVITLPWNVVEAFDYETGNILIKLAESSLTTLHPAEIADILEDVGTKERLGIVSRLSPQQAASAIEESDEETQSAILEQVPVSQLKKIVNKMHIAEIADVLNDLNLFTRKQVLSDLGTDKARKVQRLLRYEDDQAGGLMDVTYYSVIQNTLVGDVLAQLRAENKSPESIIIVDTEHTLIGTVNTRNLLTADNDKIIDEYITYSDYVGQHILYSDILRLFAEYNLRTLPVVDKDKKLIGIIRIDSVMSLIQEEEEKEDAV